MRHTAHAHQHSTTSAPMHAEIAQHAYEIFVARGATHGQDAEDWLQAEAELLADRTRP